MTEVGGNPIKKWLCVHWDVCDRIPGEGATYAPTKATDSSVQNQTFSLAGADCTKSKYYGQPGEDCDNGD